MKIYSKSFYGTHHSWACTMRSIMKEYLKDHCVSIDSINGYSYCPDDLKERKGIYIPKPDIEICYTIPRNFSNRFKRKSKLKLALYNYESNPMPIEWKNSINYIDYVLPSSNYSKQIFVDSGWSEEKCRVIPLGYDPSSILEKRNKKLDELGTFNFLSVSIPHYRKNLDLLIDAYYNSFTNKDNVCLIIKTQIKEKGNYFELNVLNLLKEKQRSRNKSALPKIYIMDDFFENMSEIYNSTHCIVNCASAEGFGLPMLEALAHRRIVIAPNKGGQIDFLNKNNSILFDSEIGVVPENHQYWMPNKKGEGVVFNVNDLSEKMLFVYKNHKKLTNTLDFSIDDKFTWNSISKKILCLS